MFGGAELERTGKWAEFQGVQAMAREKRTKRLQKTQDRMTPPAGAILANWLICSSTSGSPKLNQFGNPPGPSSVFWPSWSMVPTDQHALSGHRTIRRNEYLQRTNIMKLCSRYPHDAKNCHKRKLTSPFCAKTLRVEQYFFFVFLKKTKENYSVIMNMHPFATSIGLMLKLTANTTHPFDSSLRMYNPPAHAHDPYSCSLYRKGPSFSSSFQVQ